MFQVDKATSAVTLHKGDTGAYWVQLARKSGQPFETGDVAIYKVKQGANDIIMREYPLDGEENGRFLIAFRNSDTDSLASGTYQTEIRVSLNPIRLDGSVVDGDTVRTITKSKSTLTILDVLTNI